MRTQGTPPRQAYNAQAAVNDQQMILAAEITNDAPDFGQLAPMFEATMRQLAEHGVTETPEVVLADAGYWHHPQMQAIERAGDRGARPARREHARGQTPRLGSTASTSRCATS